MIAVPHAPKTKRAGARKKHGRDGVIEFCTTIADFARAGAFNPCLEFGKHPTLELTVRAAVTQVD